MRLPILLALAVSVHADAPKTTMPGVTIELVAGDPDVRTPTAIATDAKGRVWVLENNTHFRPRSYEGPASDRVLILEDFGPDGKARKVTTYADGFSDGMGLLLLPGGDVVLSTRAATLRLSDKDGDGRSDERRTLLKLTTTANYPHNGLSGIARNPDGALFLGIGENFGAPWKLTGTDGTFATGSDEGAILRFDEEGRGVVRWALGIWNPFGLAFDPAGRLFATDNDPGGGSFCRLLHIVRNGDYGYRYRYGRTIDHPFTSWDGRWPGTLPPMCYIGEAPTGILWHGGALLGCTWTDHGIQRFPLEVRGASFTTKPEWFIRGGHDFRPSGIAAAPDGTLYVSDWVDGSYEVHGKGRVWRIRGVKAAPDSVMPRTAAEEQLAAALSDRGADGKPAAGALALLKSDDPFLFRAGVLQIAKGEPPATHSTDGDPKVRLGFLLAARERKITGAIPAALMDADPAVRRAALQFVADERLTMFSSRLEGAIFRSATRQVFDAYIAAVESLSAKGEQDANAMGKAHLRRAAEVALNSRIDPSVRALAVRMLPVDHPALTMLALRDLTSRAELPLRIEGARVLAARSDDESQDELRRLASESATPVEVRAEALAGLALSATNPVTRELLTAVLKTNNPAMKREAARSLGQPLSAIPNAPDTKPDAAAGRRVFFRNGATACANCHQMDGRGRAIGPDLTGVWRMKPEQLIESIREPSKEIAPAYVQWHVKMKDGSEAAGIDQFVDNKSEFTLLDATGKFTKYRFEDAVLREPMPVSLMPPGLADQLTPQEFADLIAYLQERRD